MTGIDPVKLRRRNLIRPAAMPYKTAVGTTYDSGDFAPMLRKSAGSSPTTTASRPAAATPRSRGHYRGIGVSCMLEHSGGAPTGRRAAHLSRRRHAHRQSQRPVDRPGARHGVSARSSPSGSALRRDKLTHRHGNSAMEIAGYASVGSRSAMTAGASIVKCIEVMMEKGKRVAAMAFEASEGDIEYARRQVRGGRHRSPHRVV